jgi:hypothetical protein
MIRTMVDEIRKKVVVVVHRKNNRRLYQKNDHHMHHHRTIIKGKDDKYELIYLLIYLSFLYILS